MAEYALTGLSCNKCVAKATAAVTPLDPQATVTLSPPRLAINSNVSLEAINERLAQAGDYRATTAIQTSWLATYRPLLLIVGYITLVAALAADNWHDGMRFFMAGFFIAFSFFKLIDIEGFAAAYASYDLLAARSRIYALVYPFIELTLGVAYLTHSALDAVNIFTLGLMLFSGLGVAHALGQKRTIRCACLGTALKLPMTTVTLVEDFGMAAMAAAMLIL